MRATGFFLALFLAGVCLAPAPVAFADEPEAATDDSTEDFLKALEKWRKGKWRSAQKAFRKMLEEYPESVHAAAARVRSEDNCYLGCLRLHESGPSARRIDVAVMGDGFTIDPRDQQLEKKWADLCLEVLWNEKSFHEYKDYFNYYFVRLASLEEGVDPKLSPEQRAKIEERNRRRVRKKKTEYDTALDCKAAGPGGQVMADRGLVYKWLGIADQDVTGAGDDGLVIAFARFGRLGMGGGGIANVGRPDKSITVHEFGHAFTGLLDEYQGNPNPPRRQIRAANASTTNDPKEVPWAHFIEKRVKGVGIYEGGATFSKGVWRPAKSCAMNTGGAGQFCPVCREANVLAIYGYVSPIDTVGPDPELVVGLIEGDRDRELAVTPMAPRTRALQVTWHVRALADGEAVVVTKKSRDPEEVWWKRRGGGRYGGFGGGLVGFSPGKRGRGDRSALDDPPEGDLSKLGKVRKKRRARKVHYLPLAKFAPGRYAVTVTVKDTTPWVLLDKKHLLEERRTWEIQVRPKGD